MDLTIRIRNSLEIVGLSPELRSYLKQLLTISNPAWVEAKKFGRYTKNIPRYIYQFEETDGGITVPRGLLDHLLRDLGLTWKLVDERAAPKAVWGRGNVTLRPDDQEPAVTTLMQRENGFLAAPAGSGKTVMGLELCRRLGLKALWLTHQNALKEQVIEEIEEHLEIPAEEIGILHGPKWEIGEQITVGMIPTLRKRDLTLLAEEFGTVIVDEAHHVPSAGFLTVVNHFNAKHVYGLTATAYRRDKLDIIMFNAIGPKVAEIEHFELFEDEHLMIPTIKVRPTGWYPPNANLMEYQDFMEAMVEAADRNKQIVRDIVSECVPGNCFIVLVERTKHAEVLANLLQEKGIKCEFVVGSVDVEETSTPAKRGRRGNRPKRKKKAIPKKIRERIIADFKEGKLQGLSATYDLLMEGFNYPPLNRLFLASPIKWKGNVVQALGRIQRPAEGKGDAIAYDYVDERIGMFSRQADSRRFRVYDKMGMRVELPQ
jgi:superfamily II DNA or RNA helicase